MARVVVEHLHDRTAAVYRLVVGSEVWDTVPDEDGAERSVLVGHTDLEDFVFADDEKRWAGKKAEEIATEQRQAVAEALAERGQTARAQRGAAQPLPGVGEEL